MKNTTNILLGLILFVLISIFYFQTFSRIRYETKIVGYSDNDLPIKLVEDSQNGWQIVGSRRAIDNEKESLYEIILQRKVVYDILIN